MNIRHVIAEKLPFPVINFILKDNVATLRYLQETEYFLKSPNIKEADPTELMETGYLENKPIIALSKYYVINDKQYGIIAEETLNLDDAYWKNSKFPGCHISFRYSGATGLIPYRIDVLTAGIQSHLAQTISHMGGIWTLDFWCTNPEDQLCKWNRSFTTAKDSILITNLSEEELGEEWSAEDVMVGNVSTWLNPTFTITSLQDFVKPNEEAKFKVEVTDGKTGEILSNLNYDKVKIEEINGYVPKKRLKLENGVGTFSVFAFSLEEGDQVKVKLNTECFTGKAFGVCDVRNS